MSEDKKTDADASASVDYQKQIDELNGKLMKAEESAAWAQREMQKLQKVKEERDKMIDDKASTGDPEAIKKIKDEYQGKLAETEEKFQKQLSESQNALKHERVTKQAIQKAAQYFNDDALDLIETKIAKFCDWEDGQVVIRNEKGEIRYSENNKREKMGLDEFMKELTTKHPSCAKATSQPGTMTPGTKTSATGNGKSWNMAQVQAMTPSEQAQFFNANPDAAKQFLRNVSLR